MTFAASDAREWVDQASCAGVDAEVFYPVKSSAAPAIAYRVCRRCPVRLPCAREQVETPIHDMHGMWGGLSRTQARNLQAAVEAAKRRATATGADVEEVITDTITAEFDRVDSARLNRHTLERESQE